MNIYIYDGSFEGLLTAIYQAYYRPEKPAAIVTKQRFSDGLFIIPIEIKTEPDMARKVSKAIAEKISPTALRRIYRAYLSELPEIEDAIYRYLRLGFKIGRNIDKYLSEQAVMTIHQTSRKVDGERHRMLGLLRFRCTKNNIYYATMEPDFNILALIAPHFVQRLADQNWVIHDIKRGLAAFYNGNPWVMVKLTAVKQFNYAASEECYQQLWKDYYNSVTIASRKNPKLQRQFMPVRYWNHLIEKQ
ncbi:TIGR03915 family putative DNA repair protein [Peptococcaceae bacterium 1198_IL3148]